MKRIPGGFILPSAAYTLNRKQLRWYQPKEVAPQVGDAVYGVISRIGQHSSLENVSGRIHTTHNGTAAIFVYGNRYAPDYYEGVLPDSAKSKVDLLARSGMVGKVITKKATILDPTQVTVLGYVVDEDGNTINTRDFPRVKPTTTVKSTPRSRLILVVGTSMNAGKSMAASACVWTLKSLGYDVRASKVTGTASLKDILSMNDAGANPYNDFTFLGYPSTYLLPEAEVLNIYNQLDLKFANNPANYWVVEFADGIIQRETALLLASEDVQSRIDKLIFCATDAFSAIGGLEVLKEKFNLVPNAISGLASSSPLHIREIKEFTDIPVFNSANPDVYLLESILTAGRDKMPRKKKAELEIS